MDTRDPQARLDATTKALDAVMRLEARIAEVTTPWYQRHEKTIAVIGALGVACTTWLGVLHKVAASETESLIQNCPVQPLAEGTAMQLEADSEQVTSWSMDGRILRVGRSFRWPSDAGVTGAPEAYVISARAGNRRSQCEIDVVP